MSHVEENQEVEQKQTETMEVSPESTPSESVVGEEALSDEAILQQRVELNDAMHRILDIVCETSAAPNKPYKVLKQHIKDLMEQYRISFESLSGVEITDTQRAWMTDVNDIISDVPELVLSISLASCFTGPSPTSVIERIRRSLFVVAIPQRKDPLWFYPADADVLPEGYVRKGAEHRINALVEKMVTVMEYAETESFQTNEDIKRLYLPLYYMLVYPVFAMLANKEEVLSLSRYEEEPLLPLPFLNLRYLEYVEGKVEIAESALSQLQKANEKLIAEEFKVEYGEDGTRTLLRKEGEVWESIVADPEDIVYQSCIQSVIHELVEYDARKEAIYTVKTKEIPFSEAIVAVKEIVANIESDDETKEEGITITFFRLQ